MRIFRRHPIWTALTLLGLIAIVSFEIDMATDATTGPPYEDSVVSKVAFFVFLGTIPVAIALVGYAASTRLRRWFRQSKDGS